MLITFPDFLLFGLISIFDFFLTEFIMFILNLLSEEPKKFQNLLIKVVKLMTTILIINLFSGGNSFKEFSNILTGEFDLTLISIFNSILILIGLHFLIWTVLFALLISIFSFKLKSKNKNPITRNDIQEILGHARIFKKSKGNYLIPTRRVHLISELVEQLKKTNYDVASSSFLEWFFISFVCWVFFFISYFGQFIIWFAVSGVIIIISIIIWRFFDKLAEAIKSNSWQVNSLLQILIFRDDLLDTLKNNFDGELNEGETAFTIKINKRKFTIWDFAYPNETIGQVVIRKALIDNGVDFENLIVVTNLKLDQELISLLEKKGVVCYINAQNAEEITEKLVLFAIEDEKRLISEGTNNGNEQDSLPDSELPQN